MIRHLIIRKLSNQITYVSYQIKSPSYQIKSNVPFEDTERTGELKFANMVHSFAEKGHLNKVFRM